MCRCLEVDAVITHMRTTLTLDDDLARELKEEAHRTGRSFKHVVNETLRAGLARSEQEPVAKPYRLSPAHLGQLAAGIDPDKMLDLADRLHDAEALRELRARK